jgi:hypothetical protein
VTCENCGKPAWAKIRAERTGAGFLYADLCSECVLILRIGMQLATGHMGAVSVVRGLNFGI